MVVQPACEIGYRGTKLLIDQIEPDAPEAPVEVKLLAELWIRESTLTRCR
jgi:DNA-binding LacI/PurR family transcriptional regulator